VAGGASVLVDPNSPENIAQQINKIIKDEEFTKELVTRGFENIKNFSWQNTAIKTLAVLSQNKK